jgi:UDP-2,3-diacylglucosamine pyrophosphatase LpxH
MTSTHNILVVSDLHLGEDLSPTATAATARDLRLAERHLVEFLKHYARRRVDGLPWRLVVNGDMIDFLTSEHPEGRSRCVAAALDHLHATLNRHRDVTRALALFVAAGNTLEITTGNHDTELQWPEIQAAFRERIVAAWQALGLSRDETANAIAERVRFHPWFFYEKGVAWIEHGHQYDECCSYEYGLNPVGARNGEIISNVDASAVRYLTNGIPEAEPHGTDNWTMGGYMRFCASLGWRGAAMMVKGYWSFATSLISAWRENRARGLRRKRRKVHVERLHALADQWDIAPETLRTVDDLRRTPVTDNLRRLLRVIMLDKLSVLLVGLLAALVAVMSLSFTWAFVACVGAAVGTHFALDHVGKGRNIDPAMPLQLVPARILDKVDAQYVVFGHTHEPVDQQLANGARYFNTGTWLPSQLLQSFTHVVIRSNSRGTTAALCQWRDGASRAFTPGWVPSRPITGKPIRTMTEEPVAAEVRAA